MDSSEMTQSMRVEILRRFADGESVRSIKAFGVKAAEGAIVEAREIEDVIRADMQTEGRR